MVQQSQEGRDKAKDTGGIQSSQHPKRFARPVDPVSEGRCFRCLGHGHAAQDCRDPIACRLCRSPGHRQASCPLRRDQRLSPPSLGLFDCLVGEVGGGEFTWDHVFEGIRRVCPDLSSPDAHLLASGEIFIRRLSKTDWRSLLGITQQLPGGISVSWRRPKSSDGAIDRHGVIKRLEVRGVPFGLRTWNHLGRIIRPAGTLRKIVSNGVQIGDPNHVCLDVEVNVKKEIPKIIWTAGEGGRDTKIMIAALLPPPLSQRPLHISSSSPPTEELQPSLEHHQEEGRPLETGNSGCTPGLPLTPPCVTAPLEEVMEAQSDGHRAVNVLCYSRRRPSLQSGTPRGGSSWFSQLVERQWVTLRTPAQADIPPMGALESPKTQVGTLSVLSQSQEEQRHDDLIPEWVELLPPLEVGQEMGAERGDVPGVQ